MNSTPRNPPRFLPTLTEVVQAPRFEAISAPKTPSHDDIVSAVLESVGPVMERRLNEETQAMLHLLVDEKMAVLRASLREEMELLVRKAASESIISMNAALIHKN